MATTEVILRTKIDNLGYEGDVVKVKAGYARNFLLPQGKALEATERNLSNLEELKQKKAERLTAEIAEAEALSGKIAKTKLTFDLEVGENGKAFGSVTSIDIHKKLEDAGITIDRKGIQLDHAIKATGKKEIEIKLPHDVTSSLKINVVAKDA